MTADSLSFLRQSLGHAGERTLRQLADSCVSTEFAPGQLLFVEGESARGVYFVSTGRVRIFTTPATVGGREQVVRIAVPGDSFNEVPILTSQSNTTSAKGEVEGRVLLVPARRWLEAMNTDPLLSTAVARRLAERLVLMTALVGDLAFASVTSRLARAILALAGDGDRLTGCSHQALAEHVGSTREVVSRSVRLLQQSGVIRTSRMEIRIVNRGILLTAARGEAAFEA